MHTNQELIKEYSMLLLHISDIHFRSPECLTPDFDPELPYRTQLIRDVKSRVTELGAVNAILISGDIAFKGAPDEYETAMAWIKELAAGALCPLERVFVVPGNHDVDRSRLMQNLSTMNAQAAIANAQTSERERVLRAQLQDNTTSQALLEPIKAYNDFAAVFNCQVYLPGRLYWKQDLELEHKVQLRIHGLTSTILSGADGKDDSRESLYLSPLQTVLNPEEDIVNLVLAHHPTEWFMDQYACEDAINSRAMIHMFGHTHRQRILREHQYVRFSAGAVNPERQELGWLPGYNLVELHIVGDGSERRLEINSHLLQWQTSPDMFRPALTSEGEDVFRHFIRFPCTTRNTSTEVTPNATSAPAQTSELKPEEVQNVYQDFGHASQSDKEAAMGNANTRHLVYRFWNLKGSERRRIVEALGLTAADEHSLPEPERYGRALIRASKQDRLNELADEVRQRENRG